MHRLFELRQSGQAPGWLDFCWSRTNPRCIRLNHERERRTRYGKCVSQCAHYCLHTEGWAHFTESFDVLEGAFGTLSRSNQLLRLERGKAVELPLD